MFMTNVLKALENLIARAEDRRYVLRLYIAGAAPQSSRAVRNITQICECYLKGRYQLSVVDLYQSPRSAQHEHVICAPTLVKQLPLPLRRLIGDLSDTGRVLIGLDLAAEKIPD